jgi:hypothetical protein
VRIEDGTAFETEFTEFQTLPNRYNTADRISRIFGHIKRLRIDTPDTVLTVFNFDTIEISAGTLHAYGTGTVYAHKTANVTAHDTVHVIATGNATIELHDNTTGIGLDKTTLTAYDNTKITLRDFATAHLHDNTRGDLYNFSRTEVHDTSTAHTYDCATAEVFSAHAKIRARGISTIGIAPDTSAAHAGPSIVMSPSAKAKVPTKEAARWITPTNHPNIKIGTIAKPETISLEPTPSTNLAYQRGGSPALDRTTPPPAETAAATPTTPPTTHPDTPPHTTAPAADSPATHFGGDWRPIRNPTHQ